jgi:hypothetical protein
LIALLLEPHAADVPLGALVLEGLAAFEVGRNENASATAIGKAENNYREANPDYEPMAACRISDWTAERPIGRIVAEPRAAASEQCAKLTVVLGPDIWGNIGIRPRWVLKALQ